MKNSIDTYRLYENEGLICTTIRIAVTMVDAVDEEILKRAANEAIKRYPYFNVRAEVNEEGEYVLLPNPKEVKVFPVADKTRLFASKEVNEHLCFIEYEDKTIYFNISHAICGGKGAQPWVLTSVYQYVKDKYNVEPNAPAIRKPGEDLLPGEMTEPKLEMLTDEEPIFESKSKNPVMMTKDYMNGLFNPFKRNTNYYVFEFHQKSIIDYAKDNDSSVTSLFMVIISKMMNKVLPRKYPVIGAETAHNPSEAIGLPFAHFDMQAMIYVDYEREMLDNWDMEKLGTVTRSQIILQMDPTISNRFLRNLLAFYEIIDEIKGLKNKKKYMKKNHPRRGKEARHSTFVCNYSGWVDWGEVADYVKEYYYIVDGHLVFEITSLGDKIFLSMMQLIKTDKYMQALEETLEELEIKHEVRGPFQKHLSKHKLPDK